MPCVFPILSLKALSLARSGESEGAARREAIAYSAGVRRGLSLRRPHHRQGIPCRIEPPRAIVEARSEEHTSELQSLTRISYAVFCLKKKITKSERTTEIDI